MVELYLHFPICLHWVVLNSIIKYRDNFTVPLCFYKIYRIVRGRCFNLKVLNIFCHYLVAATLLISQRETDSE
jgi:hypothetical protein